MLEKTTRILSENLARNMNRRKFLRRTGETVFLGLTALAAGHSMPGFANASAGTGSPPPGPPQCAPPGPYCNLNGVNEPNGCHGGSCFQHMYSGQLLQCRVYYIYQAGCWTTAATGGGYWTCCDCECGTPRVTTCGCAQFNGSPSPRPDMPGVKS
jgi:hypothetical protein